MTITQVLYALEAGRCSSFSKAAERLFVSQPALSLQIKNLEAELGYELFARTSKGISLTGAGERFCVEAQSVADTWNTFLSRVTSQSADGHLKLRIGMGARAYSSGLFEDIAAFTQTHSDLEAVFVSEGNQDFFQGLKDSTLDLVLDRMPRYPELANQPGLTDFNLILEPQCVLMAKNDPKASLPSMRFEDLQGCTMITGLENSIEDRTLRQECLDYSITPGRIYRADGIETNMKLVRMGYGYVLGPMSFGPYFDVAAVPLDPPGGVWLKFICLEKNAARPEIAALRRYLQKICQGRNPDSSMREEEKQQ